MTSQPHPMLSKLIALMVLIPSFISAKTIFVNHAAVGLNNGTSWANAYTILQSALDGSISGDQIWVAQGTYTPSKDPFGNPTPSDARDLTFYLKNGVAIYGGFFGNEAVLDQRDPISYETILSGSFGPNSSVFHVVLSVSDNVNTVLDGCIIQRGKANGGGSLVVESLTASKSFGGGIYALNSSASFRNLRLSNNFGTMGGAICNENSTIVLRDLEIFNNNSLDGGAVANISGNVRFEKCLMRNNTSINGGAMCNATSNVTVVNNLFYGNSSTDRGGAIFNSNTTLSIINSSIAYNNSSVGGGGIYSEGNFAILTALNAIVWGNTGPQPQSIGFGPGTGGTVTYSDIQGISTFPGTGNINQDPLFVSNTNLMIMVGSPCIDAGNNSGAPSEDFDGNLRPQGGTVDMGAFETPEIINFVFMGLENTDWNNHNNWNMHYCPPSYYEGPVMIESDCVLPIGSTIGAGCEVIVGSATSLTVK
ncbi:MAG: right-handed parallel beta-helix repeat-containing protein [Saprospiraceae bacterium]|nr:right-handed parallel beta-helix repeat-containing protein [Saprospiraceae bacterium]